ncbi:hypothetical protein OC845_000957 [Tilletia horrida]|nr:hypothetical protein OC845_000957 [Tilletia horrida]
MHLQAIPLIFVLVFSLGSTSRAVPVTQSFLVDVPATARDEGHIAGLAFLGAREVGGSSFPSYPADQIAARELIYTAGDGLAMPFADRASFGVLDDMVEDAEDASTGASTPPSHLLEKKDILPASAEDAVDSVLEHEASAGLDPVSAARRAIEVLVGAPASSSAPPEERTNHDRFESTSPYAVQVNHGTPSPLEREVAQENNEQAPEKRIVYSPRITYPRYDTVWRAGDKVHVSWNTNNIPPAARSHRGFIMLGYKPANGQGGLNLHRTMATNFPIVAGHVSFTLPKDLPTRDDYIVVLFGDSGNASALFTIKGRANQLIQYLDTEAVDSSSDELHPLVYKAAQKPDVVGPGVQGESLGEIIKGNTNGLLL